MTKKTFNLTTKPWIKVIENKTYEEKEVSLIELFSNAEKYRQFAGEMRIQDISILRLCLAILITVYSRFDVDGKPYDWLEVDPDSLTATVKPNTDYAQIKKSLLNTWQALYENGKFSSIVTKYLQHYDDKFDFFGEHPFYQVTRPEYDSLVVKGKRISEKHVGAIAVKQINRLISESNNSPALSSPKNAKTKNEIELEELIRWIITFQNFTGTTDKTKVNLKDKFSASSGWLYKINPIFITGSNLFKTLLFNLTLTNSEEHYQLQKPVWEYSDIIDYFDELAQARVPNNVAALYTNWSRAIHLEWENDTEPIIYAAGVPRIENANAFVEPMVAWKRQQKKDEENYFPVAVNNKNNSTPLWSHFSNIIPSPESENKHRLQITWFINQIQLNSDENLKINTVNLVSDGSAANTPIKEVFDSFALNKFMLSDRRKWNEFVLLCNRMIAFKGCFIHFLSNLSQQKGIESQSFINTNLDTFAYQLSELTKEIISDMAKESHKASDILDSFILEAKDFTLKSAISFLPDFKEGEILVTATTTQKREQAENEEVFAKLQNELNKNMQVE